jgi:hypothetical protein
MTVTLSPTWTRWRTLQLVLALWLLSSPLVYPSGVSSEVLVKDLLAGTVLLVATVAGAVTRTDGRGERWTCFSLGAMLLGAAFVLEDGVGAGAILAQWNEVVTAVLLICLAAVRPPV